MKSPPVEACKIIVETMKAGSEKDGSDESWREESPMFHLSKAQNHLAKHIRDMHDSRGVGDGKELYRALTRIAFAISL